MKKFLYLSSAFFLSKASALDRIQAVRFDRGSVRRIYLAPGLGSMLQFPCSLQEVFIGRSEDLKAQISPHDNKILFLNLKLNSSLPTNVIAKCRPEQWVLVFDVIPNRAKHQDYVEIRSTFGRPKSEFETEVAQEEHSPTTRKIVLKAPELFQKGASK